MATPTTAHGNVELIPPFVREFQNKGLTYVYDYSLLVKQQADMAEAVYQYQVERQNKQASNSIQDYFMSQSGNYDVYVLSFILLKKNLNGTIEPFPVSPNINDWESSEQFQFAASLPVSMETEVQEVIEDFFAKPKRYMLGSMLRTNLTSAFLNKMGSQFQELMDRKTELSDLQDLISRANSNEESLKPEAPVETGSLQEATPPSSEQQEI